MRASEGQHPDKQAGQRRKRRSQAVRHLGCVASGSQRGAASKYQLQCGLLRAAAAWLSQMQTVVRRDQNKNAKCVSEKGGNACHIKWGFVSFGNVCSVPSSLRHFGSKVLVTLIFISLDPFKPHCPPNEIANECGVEDRCISRDRRVT